METSCRSLLQFFFEERVRANASYSLRAYSRDLGMAPSSLSEVLKGKKGISGKKAVSIAEALKLPDWQKTLFIDLSLRDHAKKPSEKSAAVGRLSHAKEETHARMIKMDAVRSLTSWVDLAILEITHLKDFKPIESWVAKKLAVAEAEVRDSLKRMTQSGLLKIEGRKWVDASPLFTTSDGIPSESIRVFQSSVLNLFLKKLHNEQIQDRTVKSVVFSLGETELPQAQAILNTAIAQIAALGERSSAAKTSVHCFSALLFPLTNSMNQNPETNQ